MTTEVLQEEETSTADVGKDLFLSQYAQLRAEILNRLNQRQQLLTYTLVGTASFASFGLQESVSALTVFCYPVLSFFLALAWAQHDNRIGQINAFLHRVEDDHLGTFAPGWERYRRTIWKKSGWLSSHSVALPARGLFVGTQLLLLALGIARFLQNPQMVEVFVVLVVVSSLMIVWTAFVLRHHRVRVTPEPCSVRA